jgi:hypothetical protein
MNCESYKTVEILPQALPSVMHSIMKRIIIINLSTTGVTLGFSPHPNNGTY